LLLELTKEDWSPGTFWNVNLPHLRPDEPEPRIVRCQLEVAPLPLSFRDTGEGLHYDGNYHQRRRGGGSDVDVCFSGNIAVTKLTI
jgi:5'-nucleotidase